MMHNQSGYGDVSENKVCNNAVFIPPHAPATVSASKRCDGCGIRPT